MATKRPFGPLPCGFPKDPSGRAIHASAEGSFGCDPHAVGKADRAWHAVGRRPRREGDLAPGRALEARAGGQVVRRPGVGQGRPPSNLRRTGRRSRARHERRSPDRSGVEVRAHLVGTLARPVGGVVGAGFPIPHGVVAPWWSIASAGFKRRRRSGARESRRARNRLPRAWAERPPSWGRNGRS